MDKKIKITPAFIESKKVNDQIKKMNDNEASSYIKGNFRSEVFNLKTYLTNDKTKDQILYIPVNIVSLASWWFADFVIGDGVEVEITDEKAQARWLEISNDNDFDGILYNMAIEQSVYGYSSVRVRKDDDEEIVIDQVPFEYYYPDLTDVYLWEDPKKIYIISRNVTSDLTLKYETAKIQTIEKEDTRWRIDIGIYKRVLSTTDEWDLVEEKSSEYIDFKNIYTVHNKKMWGDILWRSDFVDAIDLIQELNDRLTQISVQFVKHLNSKISVPAWLKKFLEGKDKKMDDMEVLVHKEGERPAEYIENKNSLISEAIDYLDKVIRLLSAILQVPNSFLWQEESWGAEKVEALKIKMIRFIKKINRKQRAFEKVIKKLVKDTLEFDWIGMEWVEISVKFSDKDLTDDQVMFERYTTMFDKKLLSKQSAIWYLMDWDDKWVQKEIELIDKETQANMEKVVDPKDPNNSGDQNNQDNPQDNQNNNQ